MHSSTSSFERSRTVGDWPRVWLLAIVLAVAVLGGQEAAWRAAGYWTMVTDDRDLWAYWRSQVDEACEDTVVLLGDSRIGWGFDLEVFREVWPDHRLVQLYVPAAHPVAALRDLAENEDFRGVVICAIGAESLAEEHWDQQQPVIDYYHSRWNTEKLIGRRIRTELQQRLVILNPELHPRQLVQGAFGDWPDQRVWRTMGDRHCPADFSIRPEEDVNRMYDQQYEREIGQLEPLEDITPDQWLSRVQKLDELVRRIQDRGGQVVFKEYITNGRVREVRQSIVPREEFWDILAANTSAVTVHFEDVPALRDFETAEGSHLDYSQAGRYTYLLGRELARRGVLRPGNSMAVCDSWRCRE